MSYADQKAERAGTGKSPGFQYSLQRLVYSNLTSFHEAPPPKLLQLFLLFPCGGCSQHCCGALTFPWPWPWPTAVFSTWPLPHSQQEDRKAGNGFLRVMREPPVCSQMSKIATEPLQAVPSSSPAASSSATGNVLAASRGFPSPLPGSHLSCYTGNAA